MLQALAGNKVGGPADRLGFAGKKDPEVSLLGGEAKKYSRLSYFLIIF